ncbi:MAG: GNAT family N-acetyltransferase [Bacteroidia bacterium]|nr:GNAT family N-acetyltransferase [Bacteroidia bacterium]
MIIPQLENQRAKLTLLDLSNYKHLESIAGEKDLIYYSPSDISSPEKLRVYVALAVDGYYHKTTIPFIIYDKEKQVFAGSTRFGLINWHHKVLHIGWTWLGRAFQGTGLNTHVKYLMLEYAFETLNFEKVEFRIDERNQRSRKAVEKIGAQLEGILRRDTLMQDGYRRNTCCYSILKEEWAEIKTKII